MQQRVLLPLAIYLLGVLLIGANVFAYPDQNTLGWLGTDAMDTMSLRWLFFHPEARFAPFGYDFTQLTPNIFDHLTAYPLISLFGFPQGDNLWWFGILLANACAAHLLGTRLGGELGGYWSGALLLSSEQLLREVNLHHAPQSMLFFPLLYCWSLLDIRDAKTARKAGLFLGLTAWCYLYSAFFIFVGTLPFLLGQKRSYFRQLLGIAGLLLGANLFWLLWRSSGLIQTPDSGPILGTTMKEAHSANWNFLWQDQPFDLSNQVSFLALGISIWMLSKRRDILEWKIGIFCVGFGSLMLMGVNTPFSALLNELPIFSRLTWPERWGMLLPFGIIFCSAPFFRYQHRLLWRLPPLVVLEMFLRSGNMPLHAEPIASYQCYEALQSGSGRIVELPLQHNDRLYNRSAFFQRLHRRPMVNPFILPPMLPPPYNWESWKENVWLKELDHNTTPLRKRTLDALAQEQITTIIIDRSSFSPLSDVESNLWKQKLVQSLGEPTDLGCLWAWSLSNEPPHSSTTIDQVDHQKHDFPLLIQPINQK